MSHSSDETNENSFKELVRQSAYVFQGTIKKLGATTVSLVPTTELTALVTVDAPLREAQTIRDYLGQDITIQLLRPAQVGQSATFFATGWIADTSIAVREVGRIEGKENLSLLRTQITQAVQSLADQQLQQLLEGAAIVVAGVVTRSGHPIEQRPSISFHDPQWRSATLHIQSVEKGNLKTPTVNIAYASSNDIVWYASPKFLPEQKGIWLLHTDQVSTLRPSFRIEGYMAIDPMDYQPSNELDHIRRLLGNPQEPTKPPIG